MTAYPSLAEAFRELAVGESAEAAVPLDSEDGYWAHSRCRVTKTGENTIEVTPLDAGER